MTAIVEKGSPIAVVAPCGVYDPERLAKGLDVLRAAGHDVRPFPEMRRPYRYLAAPDEVRLEQLSEALTSDEYAAVWIARGGYGLTRIVDRLPETIAPKPVIGFSDVTALFAALRTRGHLGALVHAPVVHSIPVSDEASIGHLLAVLDGETPDLAGETLVPGVAEGRLVGGNLAMLAALCGTPLQVDVHGAILVVEDIGEAPYRIDRMWRQLEMAGALDGVAGIALGDFAQCDPPKGADWTLREVWEDLVRPLGVPVAWGIPVGHGARNHAFVWDAQGRLSSGRLTWTTHP